MTPTPEQVAAARAAIAEYNEAYAAGGELEYPHWAAEVLKGQENG